MCKTVNKKACHFIDRLCEFAQQRPEALALTVAKMPALSYADLWQESKMLAEAIKKAFDDSPGDFLVVLSHRNQYQVIAIVAALIAGVPIAIIDLRQGVFRVAAMLAQGNNLLALVDKAGNDLLESINKEKKLTTVKSCLSLDDFHNGFVSCGSWDASARVGNVVPRNTAIILYTSGSTGNPKGVCIVRSDLIHRCQAEKDWFELVESDCIMGVLPLNFDVGLLQLLGSLYAGAHHVMVASWLPADILKTIDSMGADGLALSPMVWRGLLKSKNHQQLWQRLNQLRYITLSGGSLDEETLLYIVKHLHSATFIKTYGLTEMFRIASLKLTSLMSDVAPVGEAYAGVDIVIIDEFGHVLPKGEEGEIVASGMGAMGGYLSSPGVDKPKNKLDTAIATGDLGYIDTAGYLVVRGRKNEMIKVFDQRIFPADVANSLQEILDLSPIYVLASDDQEPHLIAVLESSKTDKSSDELTALIRKSMASHLVPRIMLLLDEIPVTANGKIDAMKIKQMVA